MMRWDGGLWDEITIILSSNPNKQNFINFSIFLIKIERDVSQYIPEVQEEDLLKNDGQNDQIGKTWRRREEWWMVDWLISCSSHLIFQSQFFIFSSSISS